MGHGNSRVGRGGDAGRHAGDDFKGNFCRREGFGFLSAAAKDVGVAAFEAHDAFAGLGALDQKLIDLLLGQGVVVGTLSGVDQFGGGGREAQKVFVDEGVVNHDFGASEQFGAAQSHQPGVTGTGADEMDYAFFVHTTRLSAHCHDRKTIIWLVAGRRFRFGVRLQSL